MNPPRDSLTLAPLAPLASEPPPRRGSARFPLSLSALLLATAFLAWTLLGNRTQALYDPSAESVSISPRGDLNASERTTISLFQDAAPSVVFITNIQVKRNSLTMDLEKVSQSSGSGFVWNKQGHIVTNYHVLAGGSEWEVTLSDKTSWSAEIVGVAPDKDLAVVKIDAPVDSLNPLPLGTSHDLAVGQSVLAIGNPFGLDHTLTTGIISGLGREIRSVSNRPIFGVIQTDAAINPGNSGGPLLDSAGRLIGVNTAIVSNTGAYSGIGFAVPVNIVNHIVPQIIRTGRASLPGMGVRLMAEGPARSMGVRRGVAVSYVHPGTAADKVGLVPTRKTPKGWILGDVITAVDGHPVSMETDLFRQLDRHSVGDSVTLTLERNRKQRDVKVTLQDLLDIDE